ncbi:GlsB/YeaQ/YmgE family stress response membrane protein [Gemmatimonas aurantiaca]|uniref:GlsB/YeaQ/YmgE family stress response membrane protein n=1 Tax=Gemmatimonas aurantiaca TaxID=173480 RepID=UPI00301E3F85
MGLLYTCLIGLIVGAVAKFLMPGKDPGGFIITILLGIAGAFVGTWLGQVLGLYAAGAQAGFIASVIGAMLLLFVYRLITGRKSA